jgi:hypothetical protein
MADWIRILIVGAASGADEIFELSSPCSAWDVTVFNLYTLFYEIGE